MLQLDNIYYFFKVNKTIKMSSGSLFDCCNGFGHTADEETTYNSKIRKMNSNTKKTNMLSSPKASLRTLVNQRSSKNLQSYDRNQGSRLQSTSSAFLGSTSKKQFLVPTQLRSSDKFLSVNYNSILPLSPRSREISPATSASKDRVSFSYTQVSNPTPPFNPNPNQYLSINQVQNSLRPISLQIPSTPVWSSFPSQLQIATTTCNKNCEQTKGKPLNLKPNQEQAQTQNKNLLQSKHSNKSNSTRIKLGSSMYTVQSQEEIQYIQNQLQQNDGKNGRNKGIKMEESDIIVNVFNPTQSQMENWEIKKKVSAKK